MSIRDDINRQLNRNDNKVDRMIFVAIHNNRALSEHAVLFYMRVVRPSLFRNQSRMAGALRSALFGVENVRTRERDFWD